MPVVNLGALFLLSLLLPAYLADSTIISAGSDTPVLVVFGVGSAAGVGALLSLTGSAIWNFFWPISPSGGWVHLAALGGSANDPPRWAKRISPANFRRDDALAAAQRKYWKLTDSTKWVEPADPWSSHAKWSEGESAVIATAFLLYRDAPSEVREWIRRRYTRFSDALSAATAILAGVASDILLYWKSFQPQQGAVIIVFVVIALATFIFGHASRREAVQMEQYWFQVRSHANLSKPEVTHVEMEPGSELAVRPTLKHPTGNLSPTPSRTSAGSKGR